MKTRITVFTFYRGETFADTTETIEFDDCYYVDAQLTHTIAEIAINKERYEFDNAYRVSTTFALDALNIYIIREV